MSSLPVTRRICIFGDIGTVPKGPLKFIDADTGEEVFMTSATILLEAESLPIIEYVRLPDHQEERAELVVMTNGHLDKAEIN